MQIVIRYFNAIDSEVFGRKDSLRGTGETR